MNVIRFIVDNLHVGLTDRAVLREMYDRLKKQSSNMTLAKRDERKQAYRMALQYHHENQELYREVMTGHFKYG